LGLPRIWLYIPIDTEKRQAIGTTSKLLVMVGDWMIPMRVINNLRWGPRLDGLYGVQGVFTHSNVGTARSFLTNKELKITQGVWALITQRRHEFEVICRRKQQSLGN